MNFHVLLEIHAPSIVWNVKSVKAELNIGLKFNPNLVYFNFNSQN